MSIQKRTLKNGKTVYDVIVRVENRNAKGIRKPIKRTAYSRQEAIALDAKLKEAARRGAVIDARRTVADLMEAWLDSGAGKFTSDDKVGWSPTTEDGYRNTVKREILPVIGTKKLSGARALTAQHLDKLYKDMRDEGHAGNTIRNVHACIRAALNRAVKWGWVEYSVADRATLGPILGGVGRVATEAEVLALLEAADDRLAFAIRVACKTGVRRSELAGLDWSDVDFINKKLTVQRAHVHAGRTVFVKDTKTHATRRVPLADTTVVMLKHHRGIGSMFGMTPYELSRQLAELKEVVGIQGEFGWHAFRHYCGTDVAEVGGIMVAAKMLGHARISTAERYVHTKEEQLRAAVDALDGTLG
jgi:integrase